LIERPLYCAGGMLGEVSSQLHLLRLQLNPQSHLLRNNFEIYSSRHTITSMAIIHIKKSLTGSRTSFHTVSIRLVDSRGFSSSFFSLGISERRCQDLDEEQYPVSSQGKFDACLLGRVAASQSHAWLDVVMHDIRHIQELSAGDVAFEYSHHLRPRFDALVPAFYRVIVMLQAMLPACDRYAVNQFDASVIEVFVEGTSVVAQLIRHYLWR